MTDKSAIAQRKQLAEVADRYSQQGYEIIFPPDYDKLPDAIAIYNPDLVVRNGRETVVVLVRSNRSSDFNNDRYLSHLAKEIESYSDWRLELIVNKSSNADNSPIALESLQIDEVKSKLPVARQLAEQHPEAAFLYYWSLIEATVRLLVAKERLNLREFNFKGLIKELVFNGVISRSQYQTLEEAFQIRNATAHGFKARPVDYSDIQQLNQLQQELLTELES